MSTLGIGIVELNFLKFCNLPLGRVLTIGRQESHLPKRCNLQGFSEDYLINLGALEVISLDFSDYEGSNIAIDLSIRLQNPLLNKFDTILDF